MARESHHPHDTQRGDEHGVDPVQERDLDAQQRALSERAQQLGATAQELEAALDTLARQAEVVLHRLRGGRLH